MSDDALAVIALPLLCSAFCLLAHVDDAPPAAAPADEPAEPTVPDEPSTPAAPEPAPGGENGAYTSALSSLPDTLPPLDDALIGDGLPSGPRFFAQARLRGELDDSRDFSRTADTAAGAALSGRVGIDADIEAARAIVVVGDGARIGSPSSAPLLVARPAAPQLLEVALVFDTEVAGLPATLTLGRAPVVVGDGDLVGVEPYDARGRTLDGAAVRARRDQLRAGVAVYWLGPAVADAGDNSGAFSGLAVIDAGLRGHEGEDGEDLAFDAYLLLHRDGAARVTTPTLGARLDGALWPFLQGHAGADAQAFAIDGQDPLAPAGGGVHLEAGARATAPRSASLSPRVPDLFLDAALELTTGDVVAGRSFRAPAPTQHGKLGLLDLIAIDNTWSASVAVGAKDSRGLFMDVGARVIGLVDSAGLLLDVAGAPLAPRVGGGLALVEIDARFEIPLGGALFLDVGYAVGLPGAALIGDQPAQRLYVAINGSTGMGDDALMPPLRTPH